jgi:cephalosporin hydroxylase
MTRQWWRRLFGRQRQPWGQMVWLPDRLLLRNLTFRLEHYRNDSWELGDECFRFYKVKGLIDEFERFWSTCPGFACRNALELGMWDGGSLAFWMEVLQPAKLVGVDVQDREDSAYFRRYVASRRLHQRIKTYWKTDQRDTARLQQIVAAEFGRSLDLVLDDASHGYQATKASFQTLFPLLRPGGLYIIEDWAWGHWPEFHGPDRFAGEIELTRLIEELVHAVGSRYRVPVQVIGRLSIFEGFTAIERGPHTPLEGSPFELERYIIRRPVSAVA